MTPTASSGEQRTVLRGEYTARINRVLDYIESNLGEPLSLKTLAGVANFSPYHFHRIFRAMTGETLNRFIQRVRLEKAAMQLVANPGKSITGIALDCGFSGSAAFARAFRETFGVSASAWRARKSKIGKTERNGSQPDGKAGKETAVSSMYLDDVTHHIAWRIAMNGKNINVEVREMPEMTVAYVRHTGPYKGDYALFERLFAQICTWAVPRGLFLPGESRFLAVYHDNPDVTGEDKLRVSVCITVPAGTPVDGEIGIMTIPAGKYAIGHFELGPDEYLEAWDALYGGWLPESGYQPDDRPCFEMYPSDPHLPNGKLTVDICIPVKPM